MRTVKIAMAVLAGGLLAACAATPAAPPMTIDDVSFVSTGPGVTDVLRLTPDRLYSIRRVRPAGRKSDEVVQSGYWRVVGAEQQLVLLDDKTPVRLVHVPAAERDPWRFVSVPVVPMSALPPAEKDNYLYLFDRWYVAKAALAPAGDEDAAPGALLARTRLK